MPIESGTWSGAVVLCPAGDAIVSIESTWQIPSIMTTPGRHGGWPVASCWIGIDGHADSTDVLQAGCDVQAKDSGELEVILWCEWAPKDYVVITDLFVSVGDQLNIAISADSDMQNATIVFRNGTTNKEASHSEIAPAGTLLQGNCAEWIVEALKNANQVPGLAPFSPVKFVNCKAVTRSGATIQPGSGDSMYITDFNNPTVTIAQGEIVDSTTVRVSYV